MWWSWDLTRDHPTPEFAADGSVWRPGWCCRGRGPSTGMTILQRLSKLAEPEEEINAEGYVILLKEIYRCAPELCPTINGWGNKINRPSTLQVSFAAKMRTHSDIPESHCPVQGQQVTQAKYPSPQPQLGHYWVHTAQSDVFITSSPSKESCASVRSCLLAYAWLWGTLSNLALSAYHLGHLLGVFFLKSTHFFFFPKTNLFYINTDEHSIC